MATGIDTGLLRAWLSARSLARELAAPVPDRGGFRIDRNGGGEVARWVFAQVTSGLVELARTIDAPGHLLKLCGSDSALRAVLPARWELETARSVLLRMGGPLARPETPGYHTTVVRADATVEAHIHSEAGELAARGYAAWTPDVFVYDRIVTAPAHRRIGLGTALLAALSQTKPSRDVPEVLVATTDGEALYRSLGWTVISPYATASIAPDGQPSRALAAPARRA